jgi:hypothetical protein
MNLKFWKGPRKVPATIVQRLPFIGSQKIPRGGFYTPEWRITEDFLPWTDLEETAGSRRVLWEQLVKKPDAFLHFIQRETAATDGS